MLSEKNINFFTGINPFALGEKQKNTYHFHYQLKNNGKGKDYMW